MENKLKHLEMIQGIINRMASNSFALKGWSVTLVAGIFALSSKDANEICILVFGCLLFVTGKAFSLFIWKGKKTIGR